LWPRGHVDHGFALESFHYASGHGRGKGSLVNVVVGRGEIDKDASPLTVDFVCAHSTHHVDSVDLSGTRPETIY
jgi:hypothetical protein